MTLHGKIINGGIVLQDVSELPEGAWVEVNIKNRRAPLHNPAGLWRDYPAPSDEDIAEARIEMWGNFPRDDV